MAGLSPVVTSTERCGPAVAGVSPIQFAPQVQDACDRSDLVRTYDMRVPDDLAVEIRVVLMNDACIEVFHNIGGYARWWHDDGTPCGTKCGTQSRTEDH